MVRLTINSHYSPFEAHGSSREIGKSCGLARKGKAALEAKQDSAVTSLSNVTSKPAQELQELQSSRDSQLGEVQTELADVQRPPNSDLPTITMCIQMKFA